MNLGKFTASTLIGVSISLLVSGDFIISASAAFAQERRPLSADGIELLVREGASHGRIAQLIQQHGVDFEATAALRTRLKSAGAGAEVMEAVEKASAIYVKARAAAQPPKPTVEPERRKLEEEKRKLRETLLKEEAKKKVEAERAKLEEENRKLREALKRAEAPKIAPAAPPPPETSRDGADMVSVPAGEFWMGSDDGDADNVEKPRHRVYLNTFRIDKFEVTNGLYRRFMESTGRTAPQFWNDSKWNEPQQPVVGVSWDDANAYCRWAGKRLPTEAEWEKTARGTDGRKYPWGDQWDSSHANSGESKIGKTVVVGSYSSSVSPYGAHDMAGNVWEWVADWFDADYYSRAPNRNPKGPDSGQSRVLRGGSWISSPESLRTSGRNLDNPAEGFNDCGFRCAR
jgi:iron(II)-dependent oxidoreductase